MPHLRIKQVEPYWQIGIMGWIVYFTNYFLRYNYAAAMVVIGQTEGLDMHELGLITSILFVTYGFGQLISGFLGDRLNPKAIIFCGIVGSTVSNVLMGASGDISVMRMAWGLNGICSSFLWAPMVRLLTIYMPEERLRGAILSFSYCTAFGQAGTYLLTAWLSTCFSWRVSFFVPAAMGGLSAVGWLVVSHTAGSIRPDGPRGRAASAPRPANPRIRLYWLSGLPLILIAILFMGILKDGILTWLPQMVTDTFHIEAAYAIFLSAAIPLMNSLSVWLIKRTEKRFQGNDMVNSGILFACSALGLLAVLLFGSFHPIVHIVLYAAVSTLTAGINTILISFVPLQFMKSGRSSTIAGVTNTATYLGSALSGWGLGFTADRWGWGGVNVLLLLLCILGLAVSLLASLPWRRFIHKQHTA